jgi:hypothetical protein
MIDPRFIVDMKGKSFPTYPGVLDLATKSGLVSLTTELLQVPGDGNGHTAIVQATATFEGGRTFSDVGDASPRNVGKHLIEAIIRMASTRAKGRVLRDAMNVGEALLEEIGEEPAPAPPAQTVQRSQINRGGNGARAAAQSAADPRAKIRAAWAKLQEEADACEIDVRDFPAEMTDEQIIGEGKAIRKLMQDWQKNREMEEAPVL